MVVCQQKMFNIIFSLSLFGSAATEDDMPYSADAQAADAPAHPRKRAPPVQQQGLRRQVSIGEIMENAGLTHGGFYRHFKDKDELYAEAVRWFLCEEAPKPWRRPRRNAHKRRAEQIVDAYFSLDHFDDQRELLPADQPCRPTRTQRRRRAKAAYQDVLEKLLALLAGRPERAGRRAKRALAVAALCVGGLVAARSVT